MGRPILDKPYKAQNLATGATCSFATNVMTCTVAPTTGAFAVGQVITATGVAANTTITALGTGTGGAGTYFLSTTPGTIAAEPVSGVGTVSYTAGTAVFCGGVEASSGQIVAGNVTGSTGGSASFATNVLTITVAPTGGGLAIGQAVTSAGVTPGTQIVALASGTWNAVGSTYTLNTTPGTIAAQAFSTLSSGVPLGVVVQNTDPTLNQLPTVRLEGTIDMVIGAAVNPALERRLTVNSLGQAIPVPTQTPGMYPQIGYAEEAGTTQGDLIEVTVTPDVIYIA